MINSPVVTPAYVYYKHEFSIEKITEFAEGGSVFMTEIALIEYLCGFPLTRISTSSAQTCRVVPPVVVLLWPVH